MPNPNETIKGLRDDLAAAITDREAVVAERDQLQLDCEDAENRVAVSITQEIGLTERLSAAQERIEALEGERDQLAEQVSQAQADQKNFDARVAEQVAAITGTAPQEDVSSRESLETSDNEEQLSDSEKVELVMKIADPRERNVKAREFGLIG